MVVIDPELFDWRFCDQVARGCPKRPSQFVCFPWKFGHYTRRSQFYPALLPSISRGSVCFNWLSIPPGSSLIDSYFDSSETTQISLTFLCSDRKYMTYILSFFLSIVFQYIFSFTFFVSLYPCISVCFLPKFRLLTKRAGSHSLCFTTLLFFFLLLRTAFESNKITGSLLCLYWKNTSCLMPAQCSFITVVPHILLHI